MRPLRTFADGDTLRAMTARDILPFLPLLLAVPLAALVARSLDRRRPAWSKARLAVLAALPGSVIVLLLGGYLVTAIGPASPGEIDSGGMVIAALTVLTPLYALLVLIVGMVSARVTLRTRSGGR